MVSNKIRTQNPIYKAVAYARFSSTNQREESIDAQIRAINEYCDRNGYELTEIYTDEAVSGKTAHRDNFQRMISDIMSGTVIADTILVHKFNRFARNKYDSAVYKKKLKDIGIRVVSVTQNIEDTPEGAMMESFLEAMDQYYSENLSLETKKGIRENALNGKSNGGRITLGYDLTENGEYVLNDFAPIAKRIFQDYANGKSVCKICKDLTAEGIMNNYGRPFNYRTVKYMLRNEKYIGNLIFTISKTEIIRHNGVVPAIIDMELWEKVQEIHKKMVKRKTSEERNHYLLTGKIICGVCGEHYVGAGGVVRKNEQQYAYRCKGRRDLNNGCTNPLSRKKWLEESIINAIIEELFDDETIKKICKIAYNQIIEKSKQPSNSISSLKSELNSIREEKKRLTKLYMSGKMSMEILDEENDLLLRRESIIERDLNSMLAVSSNELTLNKITSYFKKYIADLNGSDTQEIKQILVNTFIDAVYIHHNEIQLKLKINFNELKKGSDKGHIAPPIYHLPLLFFDSKLKRPKTYKQLGKTVFVFD